MNFKENLDRIDGIFAWDNGCISSGIKDDAFKEKLKLNADGETHKLVNALASKYFNCEGYTMEDVAELVEWAVLELGITEQIVLTLNNGSYGCPLKRSRG